MFRFFDRYTATFLPRLPRTLKGRLTLVLVSLLAFNVLMALGIYTRLSTVYESGKQRLLATNDQVIHSAQLGETLRGIHKSAQAGAVDEAEIQTFRNLLHEHSRAAHDSSSSVADETVKSTFETYVAAVRERAKSKDAAGSLRIAYEDITGKVANLIERDSNRLLSAAAEDNAAGHRAMELGLALLLFGILVASVIGYRTVRAVTQPLDHIVGYLDKIDIEKDGDPQLQFQTDIPELGRVVGSFNRFLGRIGGYRVMAMRQLLLEKQRADLIAASITDGIILLKGDEIVYLNPVGERILGQSLSSDTGPLRLSTLLQANGKAAPGANAIQTAITRSLPVELSLKVEDRRLFYLVQASPVTQAKSREGSEMALLPEEARDQFRSTTIVVAQDVTLMKESQEAKGHFLATLSHEIKTPVTSLTMATRLLQRAVEQIPNPSHRALILTCADDVDRLRGLLTDLLSISSFDTLTQRLEIQNVDIARLVRHSVQSFQAQAKERGVELVSEVANEAGKSMVVPMDPTKIAWALSNLLTNGLRHTPRGGRVGVKVQTVEDRVEVRVKDTGPGIEQKRQSQIFEKFNSFYDIRIARSGSAGVGLAIAREIVVAHQGRIWVTSEPGLGAEFCFSLPVQRRVAEFVGTEQEKRLREAVGNSVKGAPSGTATRS